MSIGRYRGKGSVMNFNKSDGVVKWHAEFENVSQINAHAQDVESDELFICGHYQPNEASLMYMAVIARMMSDGEVDWLHTISGINPDTSIEKANVDQDLCKGVSYDPIQSNLAVVIQGKMKEARYTQNIGDHFDTILLLFNKESIENLKVISIS